MKSIAIASLTCAITSMSAHAGITYSGVNETFTNCLHVNSSSVLTIAGAEFEFGTEFQSRGNSQPNPHWAYFAPNSQNATVFLLSNIDHWDQWAGAYNFSEGETIGGPDEHLRGPATGSGMNDGSILFNTWLNDYSTGDVHDEHYTGFVVGSGEDRIVGWAHFEFEYYDAIDSHSVLTSATMTGWAYNNAPGGSIMAGQTEAMVVVPGVAGVGSIIGLCCVRRNRRRS